MAELSYLQGPQTNIEKRERFLAGAVTLFPLFLLGIGLFTAVKYGFGFFELLIFLPFYILGEIGAEVGHHRYFSHRAFKANKGLKIFLTITASCSGKGSIFEFAAVHRRHHSFGDKEGDPHSPHLSGPGLRGKVLGFLHSYYGWIFKIRMSPAEHARVLDLLQDPVLRKWGSKQMYYFWLVIGFIIPSIFGFLLQQNFYGALIGLVWGGGVRLFFEQHTAFAINSICHLWGSRPFKTDDESRNNLPLALLTLGVGWHNNHHAFPFTSSNQFHWWQLDPCGWFIKFCALCGWATDLKFPTSQQFEGLSQDVDAS